MSTVMKIDEGDPVKRDSLDSDDSKLFSVKFRFQDEVLTAVFPLLPPLLVLMIHSSFAGIICLFWENMVVYSALIFLNVFIITCLGYGW